MTAQVEALLHRHRNAGERSRLVLGDGVVSHTGFGAGALEIANDDGVDLFVERLDARDSGVTEFGGAERLSFQPRRELGCRHLVQAGVEIHGAILRPGIARASGERGHARKIVTCPEG